MLNQYSKKTNIKREVVKKKNKVFILKFYRLSRLNVLKHNFPQSTWALLFFFNDVVRNCSRAKQLSCVVSVFRY